MKKLPEKLQEILKQIGMTERQATWDCHGTPVVLHKALEKVAAENKILFDAPNIDGPSGGIPTSLQCFDEWATDAEIFDR